MVKGGSSAAHLSNAAAAPFFAWRQALRTSRPSAGARPGITLRGCSRCRRQRMASVVVAVEFFPCAAVILLLQATSVLRPTFYTLCLLDCALLICSKAPKGFCYPWNDVKKTERPAHLLPYPREISLIPAVASPSGPHGRLIIAPRTCVISTHQHPTALAL